MPQNRSYVPPIDSTGAAVPPEAGRGTYTLAANTTYYFVVGVTSGAHQSITLSGLTAGLIITSATVQDTDHGPEEVSNFDATDGGWINEDAPTPAFVPVDGTGWTVTNSVVAVAGSGVGGARWNLSHDAATRTRLAVVVGATGGAVRVSCNAKAP